MVSTSARSVLLRTILSANATCSTASFSTPSGLTSSKCSLTCAASTIVMIASSRRSEAISSSMKKVCATGAGSASPVVSIRMRSKRSLRFIKAPRMRIRSPRTVQQMQPLFISKISSSASSTSASSIPTSPNSFSMTAMRCPCSSVRMRLSSVVLPEPRNPVSTVTGTRSSVVSAIGLSFRAVGAGGMRVEVIMRIIIIRRRADTVIEK